MKNILDYIEQNKKIYTSEKRARLLHLFELHYKEEYKLVELAKLYEIKISTLYRYRKKLLTSYENEIDFFISNTSKLNEGNLFELGQILKSNPWEYGFSNAEWSTYIVQKLIKEKYNVTYCTRTIERLLEDYRNELFYQGNVFNKKLEILRSKNYTIAYIKIMEVSTKRRVVHRDKINMITQKPEFSRVIIISMNLEHDEKIEVEIVNDYEYESTIEFLIKIVENYGRITLIFEDNKKNYSLLKNIDDMRIDNLTYILKPKDEDYPMKLIDIIEIIKDYLIKKPLNEDTLVNKQVKNRILKYISLYQ